MFNQHQSLYLRKLCQLGLSISLIAAVMLSMLPLRTAQADAPLGPAAQPQPEPVRADPPPGTGTNPAPTSQDEWVMDLIAPDTGVEVSSEGTLPLPASAGGSLPGGIDSRSLPAGITVDLTYDMVMGWVGGGEIVRVTAGADGYGAAVADGSGFFWTPIWHNTDGHGVDLVCGTPVRITVESNPAIDITPPCLTGGIDVLDDEVSGTITGVTVGTALTATLGGFDMDYPTGGLPPAPGAPQSVGNTAGDGSFTLPFVNQDLGAESLVAVEFEFGGVNVRSYLYPLNVFMVHQYHTVAGYAAIGQDVAVTVYEGSGPTVRWSETATASYPHGFYRLQSLIQEMPPIAAPIEVGDTVEVALDGVPTLLTTTVAALGGLDFDAGANTLVGIASEGDGVRASLWQWSGEDRLYQEAHATAVAGDFFSMNFTDLRPRDAVLVVVPDANGHQVQLASGPPFVSAYISLDSNLDCVAGRLDGPGLPIYIDLDKVNSEVYTRDTGWFTDAGNILGVTCFVVRDGEENIVNFDPADTVTLRSDDPLKWAGSVDVVDFSWSGDTDAESISGFAPDGDMEVTVHQWEGGQYPLHGTATRQTSVSGGSFTAGFTAFDVRDGVTIDFSHYDPVTGYATQTNSFSNSPTLPYFQLYTPWGVSGMSATPGETATAKLYDGATWIAETSDDWDGDPYSFWLGDFGGHNLQPGYRVEVSTSGGWSAEMIIPDLTIEGDLASDIITATGPDGLLYLEVNDNENGWSRFVPGSPAKRNLSFDGWDLLPTDTASVVYQAEDGNRAWAQGRFTEVYDVGFDLQPGASDGLWGSAKPGSTVDVELNGVLLFTAYADPSCGGCWGSDGPLDINPGDTITVTAGAGEFPVQITVSDPLTASADSTADTVGGQIDGWSEDWVTVDGWWEGGYQEIMSDIDGNYLAVYDDVPKGGSGYVRFGYEQNGTWIGFNLYFQTPDLILEVNYTHDWVQGNYEAGHTVTVTVTASDGITEKGTATMVTGPLPWSNQPGFSTSYEDPWDSGQPDIQPGDWVFGEVVGTGYEAEVRLGTITGEVDVDTDSISGTVAASWLPQDVEVGVWCHPWGSPEWVDSKGDTVLPNDDDAYHCAWDPATEWDVEPNQDIAVSYQDPQGHWIYDVYRGYSDDLILTIHYDHDWIQGYYEPGHTVTLRVDDSIGLEKAHITVPTGPIDDWGGQSGFSTTGESAVWSPEHPDIQPGDTIHGEVDDGSEFWADVKIASMTGAVDVDNDRVTGMLDADWLLPGPVDIGCYVWENDGVNVYTTVAPDGVETYTCEFTGDNTYDLTQGTNLMAAYFEPAGHEVIGDFSAPAPYLRIQKWPIGGDGSLGVGGNAAFEIQYQNQGNAPAEGVTITDTLVGMTYIRDTSGITPTVVNDEVTWVLDTVEPSDDWISFVVYVEVTAALDAPVSNSAEIISSTFDMGEEWEKTSFWEGTVAANDTHLNVGKGSWTQNPAPGEDFVYTINVCNNGSTNSSTVTVTDALPDLTTYHSFWSWDAGWEEEVGGMLVLSHPSISAWTCSEVYVRVTLDESAQDGTPLTNEVTIAADNDMEIEDNTAVYEHQVGVPYKDLAVYQNFNWGSLTPGGYYRYNIDFNNQGNTLVPGEITLTAQLPAGTSFAGWDSWGLEGITKTSGSGSPVTWTLGDMIAGAHGTIEVWVDIDPGTAPDTLLEHIAIILLQDDESDPYNNTSTMEEKVYPHGPNLRIRKDGGVHGDGQSAWYNLSVDNIGDQTVNNVVITDDYPSGMALDGGVNVNYWDGWDWADNDPVENAFSVILDRLEPGDNVGINYNTVLTGGYPGPGLIFANTAEVTPLDGDTNPEDNSASWVLSTGPDMYVQKSHGDLGEDSLTYKIEFGNLYHQNNWQWDMAGNVVLTDTLPAGMAYQPGSAELHWCDTGDWCPVDDPMIDGQTLTWEYDPMGSGEWNEIRFTVDLDPFIDTENLPFNKVEITSKNTEPDGDIDPFPANNISFSPDKEGYEVFVPLFLR